MTIPVLNTGPPLFTVQRKRILEHYLSEQELADQLGVKRSTLARWRRKGIGPPHTRRGKTPLYHDEGTDEWLRDGGTKARHRRGRSPP
jgi:hypothetical protein